MATDVMKLPRQAAKRLGYYVYAYVDPVTETVLYIGKGHGGRVLSHLKQGSRNTIAQIVRNLRSQGQEPRIDILAHNLPSEDVALMVEAAAIDLIGIDRLANAVRGHGTLKYGRAPLKQLVAMYSGRKQLITEPSLLIRINKLYHFGMTDQELYDATRSAWVTGLDRNHVQYAFAVFDGIVKEIYQIAQWLPAGTTFNSRYGGRGQIRQNRWEFVGTIADESTRRKYKDRWVGHYFLKGAANPIQYVNVKAT